MLKLKYLYQFWIDFCRGTDPLRRYPGSKDVSFKQNMSLGHSEVSFNHSCLKVPVNSSSRKPSPKYERLASAKTLATNKTSKEYPLSNLYNNFTSVKSYLEFYESIPDYSELHHLSSEDFYSRLKSLKQTQKRFCSESGVVCSIEEDYPDEIHERFYSSFGSQGKISEKKNDRPGICSCCLECSPATHFCNVCDTGTKALSVSHMTKQQPPKINIISDNENSDLYDPEFKKHSGYEADRESSTLQVGEKSSNNQKKVNVGYECPLGSCSRRSKCFPVSLECDCISPEFCHRFSEISFRNEGCHGCSPGCCFSEKDKESSVKTPKKQISRPVPLTSRIPLFDKIMIEKEARRRIIHDRYSEELRSLVKPFSFTKREEEKEKLRMISSNPELTTLNPPIVRFKAKPIPKNLFSNYAYEKMKEDEFYRALKKRIRSEELLKSSSLPPSMALRERLKSRSKSLDFLNYKGPKKSWSKANGYRKVCSDIKKNIEYDQKKTNAPKRKLRSSYMSTSRRINSATDSSTEISPYECIVEPASRAKSRPHSAFSGRNNLASVLRIETARKRLEKEMEEKLQENRLKNEAKFKARLMRMTPAWRELSFDKDEDLALRMAARREEERKKRAKHQKLMDSIYGRVYRMPPLFHKERFINGKKSRNTDFNEKDSVTFSYSIENHQIDPECEELQEEEKNSKSYNYPLTGQKENDRSHKSSDSLASCDKNEKDKAYDSDEII